MQNALQKTALGSCWRPKEYLEFVEHQAKSFRKELNERVVSDGVSVPTSKSDLEKLLNTVEQLACHGKSSSAEDAEIAVELVEQLVDQIAKAVSEHF